MVQCFWYWCTAILFFGKAANAFIWGHNEPNEPADGDPGKCWGDEGFSFEACCHPFWRGGNPVCWDVHSFFSFSRCCVNRAGPSVAGGEYRVPLPRPPLVEASTTRMRQSQQMGCWLAEGLSFDRCCMGSTGDNSCWNPRDMQTACCMGHPEWEVRTLQASILNAAYTGGADAHMRYFVANLNKYAGYSGALPQLIQALAYLSSMEVGRRAKEQIVKQHGDDPRANGTTVRAIVPIRVLDIGAGFYESNPGDQMMAVRSLRSWGGCSPRVPVVEGPDWVQVELDVQVYAFEPAPTTYENTKGYIDYILRPEERKCVDLRQLAVSNYEGNMKLFGSANNASLAPHIFHDAESSQVAEETPEVEVAVITVDEFAEREGIEFLDFVKIDCEGMDWQVVLGMQRMLRQHRVEAVALEVSEKMNPSTWRIATGEERPPADVRNLEPPTLLQITQWFDEIGYDGFLIGSLVLTPITGAWWRDEYEVCADPEKNFGRDSDGFAPCWVDAIYISRRSPLGPVLLDNHRPLDRHVMEHLCVILPACRLMYEKGEITDGHWPSTA